MKKTVKFEKNGITIIELLVSIGLFLGIFLLATINIQHFRKNAILDANVNETVTFLQSAQSKTLSGEAGLTYKVQFTTSTIQLLNQSNTIIDKMTVDSLVQIVPPAGPISFNKASGTSNGGTIIIRLKDLSKSNTITVSTLGQITTQ